MVQENLWDALDCAILQNDIETLLNLMTTHESASENSDFVINRIGEYCDQFLCSLPEKELNITDILNLIAELIQVFSLSFDQTIYLSKYLLSFACNENCSISNIKRAIQTLNSFLSNPTISISLLEDTSLLGLIKTIGWRIPSIGEFECQALIFETLCRLAISEETKCEWATIWFPLEKLKSLFLNLKPEKFESECRKILNCINRNEPVLRVFSFVSTSVSFGNIQLRKPNGCEFWIDFNFGSKSISFYCSDISSEDSEEDSWDTISIPVSIIRNFSISNQAGMKLKKLILYLNCNCDELTSTNSADVMFDSNEVKITFWSILEIHNYLAKVFDIEEATYPINEENTMKRKVSVCSDIVSNSLEENGSLTKRMKKVSEVSELTEIYANEDSEMVCEKLRKISDVDELMQLSDIQDSEMVCEKLRKISDVDELVQLSDIQIEKTYEETPVKIMLQEESELIISPTPQEQQISICNKTEKKKSKKGLSFKNKRNTVIDNNNYSGNHEAEISITEKSPKIQNLNEDSENLSPKVRKQVRLFNVDSTPLYNLPPSAKINSMSQKSYDGKIFSHSFHSNENNNSENKRKISQPNTCSKAKNKILYPKTTISSEIESLASSVENKLHVTEKIPISEQPNLIEGDSNQPMSDEDILEYCSEVNETKNILLNEKLKTDESLLEVEQPNLIEGDSNQPMSDEDILDYCSEVNATKNILLNEKLKTDESLLEEEDKNGCEVLSSARNFENSDEDFLPLTTPKKKPRRAALRAMKRNKKLLECKELGLTSLSEKNSDCTYKLPLNPIISKAEIKDNETNPPAKKKSKAGSIFQTETETGSSEISWYKRAKYGLFQTPPLKSYSRKSVISNKSEYKTRKRKHSEKELPRKKHKKYVSDKSSESETKSKHILSDVENYSLVIERDKKISTKNTNQTKVFEFDLLDSFSRKKKKSLSKNNFKKDLKRSVNHHPFHGSEESINLNYASNLSENELENNNYISSKFYQKQHSRKLLKTNLKKTNLEYETQDQENSDHETKDSLQVKSTVPSYVSEGNIDDLCFSPQNSLNSQNHIKKECKKKAFTNKNLYKKRDSVERNSYDVDNQARSFSETTIFESASVMQCNYVDMGTVNKKLSNGSNISSSHERKKGINNLSPESLSTLQDERSGKQQHLQLFFERLTSDSSPFEEDITPSAKRISKKSSHHSSMTNFSCKEKTYVNVQKAKRKNSNKIADKAKKKLKRTSVYGADEPLKSPINHKLRSEENEIENSKTQEKKFNEIILRNYHYPVKNKKLQMQNHILNGDMAYLKGKKNRTFSTLNTLTYEVNDLSKKLVGSLQKYTFKFSVEMKSLRTNFLESLDDILIQDASNLNEKDLKLLAQNCKENRQKILNSMNNLLESGKRYFETERKKQEELIYSHRKIYKKYCCRVKLAVKSAVKNVEERIMRGARELFKTFFKSMDYI